MKQLQVFDWNNLEELKDEYSVRTGNHNFSYKNWYPNYAINPIHNKEADIKFAEKINEKLIKHGMVMEDGMNFKVLIEIYWY